MKHHRHGLEQVVCLLGVGERILNGVGDLVAVLRSPEILEATWPNRWAASRADRSVAMVRPLREVASGPVVVKPSNTHPGGSIAVPQA